MPVLHTSKYKVFGSKLCLGHSFYPGAYPRIAKSGERKNYVLIGIGSPVRSASGARYLLKTGVVSNRGSEQIDGQVTLVSRTGRVRLCGHVKRSSLNYAGYLEFTDGMLGVRACATSFA